MLGTWPLAAEQPVPLRSSHQPPSPRHPSPCPRSAFVAFGAVQKAYSGSDMSGLTSIIVPAAVLTVPNVAFMAARGGLTVNPFLVGTAYATVVAEIYRKFATRNYKYNPGHRNGL